MHVDGDLHDIAVVVVYRKAPIDLRTVVQSVQQSVLAAVVFRAVAAGELA